MKFAGNAAVAIVAAVASSLVGVGMARAQGGAVELQEIVVQTTPVPGAVGISVNKVPSLVSSVPAKDFAERRRPASPTR